MNLSPILEADAARSVADRLFATLDRAEVMIVARSVSFCERAGLQRVARTATRLGNGSLYPTLTALLVFFRVVPSPVRFVVATSVSVLLALAVYPRLKSVLGRLRPCDYDRSLVSDIAPLDRYSCPSGHSMTAMAFAIPLAFACPPAAPFAAAMCLIIGWSRVALGHHYVSDVVAGAVIGATIAFPVVATVL